MKREHAAGLGRLLASLDPVTTEPATLVSWFDGSGDLPDVKEIRDRFERATAELREVVERLETGKGTPAQGGL